MYYCHQIYLAIYLAIVLKHEFPLYIEFYILEVFRRI